MSHIRTEPLRFADLCSWWHWWLNSCLYVWQQVQFLC